MIIKASNKNEKYMKGGNIYAYARSNGLYLLFQ